MTKTGATKTTSRKPVELGNDLGRPTAHDVAQLAGVSQPAVSRAFTKGASISPETRERILEVAARLGYRPNLIARSLSTQRSSIIGVAMSYLDNHFYGAILEKISTRLTEAGYGVLLFPPRFGASSEPLLEDVLRTRVDAVILASASVTSRFAEECARARVPVILVNRRTDSASVSSVTGQNEEGGRQIARLFLNLGHHRVAFLAGLEESSTSQERERGFGQGLAEAGMPAPLRAIGHYNFEAASEATAALLARKDRPDAIFCANDHMAFATIQTAREEFGLVPGRDISIVGFDDTPLAAWPMFSLTTFSQPIDAMAERVVDVTLQRLEHPDLAAVQDIIPGQLILRRSTRPI